MEDYAARYMFCSFLEFDSIRICALKAPPHHHIHLQRRLCVWCFKQNMENFNKYYVKNYVPGGAIFYDICDLVEDAIDYIENLEFGSQVDITTISPFQP